jgi:hypothetical protein
MWDKKIAAPGCRDTGGGDSSPEEKSSSGDMGEDPHPAEHHADVMLALGTKSPGRVFVQQRLGHRAFAANAFAVGPILKSAEGSPQLVNPRIRLEGKYCIDLVRPECTADEHLLRYVDAVRTFEMFEQP